ncbi:hypothetical protein Csa_010090 [Cucumis sativus]|uniref:Uncharacterized protein n=1 Tax=Cucumis sativus TaxID=3659 RepID=A0A0A0LCG0_CUCSA|nr:hypothetical protein Csa_010090 [Cucumis sativus]
MVQSSSTCSDGSTWMEGWLRWWLRREKIDSSEERMETLRLHDGGESRRRSTRWIEGNLAGGFAGWNATAEERWSLAATVAHNGSRAKDERAKTSFVCAWTVVNIVCGGATFNGDR